MKCPACGKDQFKTIDCRTRYDDKFRRRKECLLCGQRWTTLEMPVEEYDKMRRLIEKARDTLRELMA